MSQGQQSKLTMTLSVTLGAILFYMLALNPLWVAASEARDEAQGLEARLASDQSRVESLPSYKKKWQRYQKEHQLTKSKEAAQANVLEAIGRWTQASRIKRTTLSADRVVKIKGNKEFLKLEVKTSASGSIGQIVNFLQMIEDEKNLPIKVEKFTLNSSKSTEDRLKMSLTLSTIYQAPQKSRRTSR